MELEGAIEDLVGHRSQGAGGLREPQSDVALATPGTDHRLGDELRDGAGHLRHRQSDHAGRLQEPRLGEPRVEERPHQPSDLQVVLGQQPLARPWDPHAERSLIALEEGGIETRASADLLRREPRPGRRVDAFDRQHRQAVLGNGRLQLIERDAVRGQLRKQVTAGFTRLALEPLEQPLRLEVHGPGR